MYPNSTTPNNSLHHATHCGHTACRGKQSTLRTAAGELRRYYAC
jgi:hypothetical protein